MKRLWLLVLAGMVMGATLRADETGWFEDFEKAKATAKEKQQPLLVNFSGSDWCGWCIRLDKEVFSKQAFKDYADANIVLFVADFPNKKKQAEEVVNQNKELQKRYGVRGYPTVLLMDDQGKVLAKTGYQRGGADKYVEHLKKLLSDVETTPKAGASEGV